MTNVNAKWSQVQALPHFPDQLARWQAGMMRQHVTSLPTEPLTALFGSH